MGFSSFVSFKAVVNRKQIFRIFEDFKEMKAIVIGDAMVDTYMRGIIERISPEAPIPIVSITEREDRLGGAANVSLNLQALGAEPYLFSAIGNDENGRKFKQLLEKKELTVAGIICDDNRKTTVKNRIISKGRHIARVDEESTHFIDTEAENKLVSSIQKLAESEKIDVILFVDYDKGVITPTLFDRVSDLARKRGIPTAVDPKKRNFHHYKNVSLFKPNFKEFTEGIGIQMDKTDLITLQKQAADFMTKQNFSLIFVTLSELGVFISDGTQDEHYPAEIRDIADVSGAGDTVISVASLAMAAGLSPQAMALMSNMAGGLVCEKTGVVPVNCNQLIKEMLLRINQTPLSSLSKH